EFVHFGRCLIYPRSEELQKWIDFLFDFKEFNGGTIFAQDNRACAIRGSGKNRRVNVIKGSLMVISRTMKEKCMYSLDGSANLVKLVFVYNKRRVLHWCGINAWVTLHELQKREVLGKKGIGTLQHNGLAEQRNMTLLNKVGCLLIQYGLPDLFSAKITVTTTYLISWHPSLSLGKNTPMYLWLEYVKPKIIIRDVVFNESLIYKDTLKGVGDTISRKEVEFEVKLYGSKVEPVVSPHTWENPGYEDKGQDKDK
nr:copia-like retroelement Pol polyprotein [Tanacetum cinerariifolium]